MSGKMMLADTISLTRFFLPCVTYYPTNVSHTDTTRYVSSRFLQPNT